MKPEQFERLVSEFTDKEDEILNWKRNEYSGNDDRIQNFREVANLKGCKASEIALTYLLKHIQAISHQVGRESFEWEWETAGGEGLKQRFADARNYLLLLAACIQEEVESLWKPEPKRHCQDCDSITVCSRGSGLKKEGTD